MVVVVVVVMVMVMVVLVGIGENGVGNNDGGGGDNNNGGGGGGGDHNNNGGGGGHGWWTWKGAKQHITKQTKRRHEVADSHFRLLDPPEGLNIDSVNQVLCKLIRGQAFAGAHRETSYHAHEQSDQATLEALVARGLVERVGLSDYKILKVCLDRMGLVTVLHSPVFPLVSPQSLPFSEMTTYQLADVLIQKGWAFKDYKH